MIFLTTISFSCNSNENKTIDNNKPRIIVTSDGEIDDECSMIRFLLYANDWDIEGIVTSSSQLIYEVKDNGLPQLTRYKRVIINVKQ